MHVVLAPDAFAGLLTSSQAAEAMAAGWSLTAPDDVLTRVGLSDGGPGFLGVLTSGLGGDLVGVTVQDPLGRPVPASILVVTRDGRRTAYVEAAQAAGLHLLAAAERDPFFTSTYGVGELLLAARAADVDTIIVGLGGLGTTDGGAGALAALGVGDPNLLGRGGLALAATTPEDLSGLAELARSWAGVRLVLATGAPTPLLGLQGASATFAPILGADAVGAQALEGALGTFVDAVRRALGPERADLLSGQERRVDRDPYAGAGGGLAYGLLLLGGRPESAVDHILDRLDVPTLVAAADLVVTGTGTLDWESLHGSVVSAMARTALGAATPAIALAGRVLVGRREAMAAGFSGTYELIEGRVGAEDVAADPVGILRERAARVAATWSPRR